MRLLPTTRTALLGAMTALLCASSALAGGVLRLDDSPIGEIDPAKGNDSADTILAVNLYDSLVRPVSGGGNVEGLLAKSWTATDTEYTFTLRDDVKFQSGNPLTAEDVVFSFNRMKALNQGNAYLFAEAKSAEAVDAHTVKFTLSQPYAPFLFALQRMPILDSALVKQNLADGDYGDMGDYGQAYLSTHTASSGAYKIVSHNPQQETVMERNDDYFLGVPEAAPDEVHLIYGLEPATVRTQIPSGAHDISSIYLPPEVLKSLSNEGAHLLTEHVGGGLYIKMNTTMAPLDDVNCRLALANAYDYATGLSMIQVTDDVASGSASTGAIPVGLMGANEGPALSRDMDKAREYLSQCKYNPADYTLDITWIGEVPLEERFAMLMQANFTELGFKSEIRKVPWALFTEQVSSPETTPMISQAMASTNTGDVDALLYPMYDSKSAGTWLAAENLNDPEVDKLLEEGRSATDTAKRTEIYHELNDKLMALSPTIYAYDAQSVYAASNRVEVPALQDPDKEYGFSAYGLTFRDMVMKD